MNIVKTFKNKNKEYKRLKDIQEEDNEDNIYS